MNRGYEPFRKEPAKQIRQRFMTAALLTWLYLSGCSGSPNSGQPQPYTANPERLEIGQDYTIRTTHDLKSLIIHPPPDFHSPYGYTEIGGVVVAIPLAKIGERYRIKATDIRPKPNTPYKFAVCEFISLDGEKKGQCLDGN